MRIGRQGPADREHLLFATGQLAAAVVAPLREAREQPVHFRESPGLRATIASGGESDQVFLDRQIGEDLPAFRDDRDTESRDLVGREPFHALPTQHDAAASRPVQAENAAHGGCLAHAVASEQGQHFPFADGEIDAEQHLAAA